jgi:hypothetical protein
VMIVMLFFVFGILICHDTLLYPPVAIFNYNLLPMNTYAPPNSLSID